MKKNFDRRRSHSHHQWLKAPRTGATRTLSWIARIHSHTYINTVTITWCTTPALIVKVPEGEGAANRSTRKKVPHLLRNIPLGQ